MPDSQEPPAELVPRAFQSPAAPAARGVRYAHLDAPEIQRLGAWLAAGHVEGGAVIKPGRVYRHGDWILKLFEFSGAWRDHLRRSAAERSARRHLALQPIGTPRPVATLSYPRGRSLLAMERVQGISLLEALETDERAALDAFPRFMAGMHRNGVYHGDLHVAQMLWDGGRWFLLDLDGVRHWLRRLRGRALIEAQWVRLNFDLQRPPELERLFRDYAQLARPGWDASESWKRILASQPDRT